MALACKRAWAKGVCIASSAALALTMAAPMTALAAGSTTAQTFTEDGITYMVKANGTVSVGNGEEAAVSKSITGDVTIPSTVTHDGTGYTVSSVAGFAFGYCEGLDSVTLPATVTSLGDYAFANCAKQTSYLREGADYKGLEHIYLPEDSQLASIGDSCFANDYNLEAFTFPKSLKVIATHAFRSCYSFTTFKCEEGSQLTSVGTEAFINDYPTLDTFYTSSLSARADAGYVNSSGDSYQQTSADASIPSPGGLKTVVLPASLTSLGQASFRNQRSLTSLAFEGESIPFLGNGAFSYCAKLKEVEIPDTTDTQYSLGQYVFAYCYALEKVTFNHIGAPAGRWSGLRMFDGDTELSTVIFMDNKVLPVTRWVYGIEEDEFGNPVEKYLPGFNDSDPLLYSKVSFYSSKSAEEAGGEPDAWAAVREDCKLGSINASMPAKDDKGALVAAGSIPALPSGYDAWGFTTGTANDALDAPAAAYPVKTGDLAYGSVVLSQESYVYSETPCVPELSVVDAAGTTLDPSLYVVTWERLGADGGTWTATADFTSVGTLRARATAVGGGYSGDTATEFTISYSRKGDTFSVDGVTYVVIDSPFYKGTPQVRVGDGTATAVDAAASGAVSIPAQVSPEGSNVKFQVTAIADNAFADCDAVTAVTLPEGLKTIGTASFAQMDALKAINIPASVTSIGSRAFYYCWSLEELTFEGSAIEDILTQAFMRCTALTSLSLPAITSHFEGNAFGECTSLKSIVFRGKVTPAPAYQFNKCSGVRTVTYSADMWGYKFPGATVTCSNYLQGGTYTAGSGAAKGSYKITSASKKTVVLVSNKTSSKTAQVPASVKLGGKSYSVVGISKSALKGSKATTLNIASTKLTKASVKGALSGSKVKTVKVPASKRAAYKKAFTKANCGAAVAVK